MAAVEAAVDGVKSDEILLDDWKGVGAPISSVDCFDSGAGVFGGGIITLSLSSWSAFPSFGDFFVELDEPKDTSARDLKQLLSSVSPSEKKLELAALWEMGEIATRE